MLRRVLPMVLLGFLALGLAVPPRAAAMELGRILWRAGPKPVPNWQGNPRGYSAGIPAPHRYPEYNTCSPWYGYGFGVPTYSWGYFGATYRPACFAHNGYYGDFTQWGYRRGY